MLLGSGLRICLAQNWKILLLFFFLYVLQSYLLYLSSQWNALKTCVFREEKGNCLLLWECRADWMGDWWFGGAEQWCWLWCRFDAVAILPSMGWIRRVPFKGQLLIPSLILLVCMLRGLGNCVVRDSLNHMITSKVFQMRQETGLVLF